MRWPAGKSATWNPVAQMIVSAGRSVPSVVTIEWARTSAMPSVTTSTSGRVIVGYQSSEMRMRLQPIV